MGTFTFWGIGLLDKIIQRPEDDPKQWETSMERQEQKADFQKGAIGMAHTLSWNDNTYLRSNIGITFSGTKAENHIYDNELNRIPVAFATKHETNLQIIEYSCIAYSSSICMESIKAFIDKCIDLKIGLMLCCKCDRYSV